MISFRQSYLVVQDFRRIAVRIAHSWILLARRAKFAKLVCVHYLIVFGESVNSKLAT